jgi:succinate dehydrogenase hydrophobic anchor subunit
MISNNFLFRFFVRLVRGEIDFASAFWIYATFIPSALFFFVTLILLELLTDTQVVVVISLVWLYTFVAWVGAWRSSRNYQGPAEWKFAFQFLFCAFMVVSLYTFYTSEAEDVTERERGNGGK